LKSFFQSKFIQYNKDILINYQPTAGQLMMDDLNHSQPMPNLKYSRSKREEDSGLDKIVPFMLVMIGSLIISFFVAVFLFSACYYSKKKVFRCPVSSARRVIKHEDQLIPIIFK